MRGKLPDIVVPVSCVCGDHAFAPCGRALTTMVSPEDAHLLERKWFTGRYAPVIRVERVAGKTVSRRLAREVMSAPDGVEVDHINRDPRDNRRANLRLCSHEENCRNRLWKTGAKTALKGVFPSRSGKRYRAAITVNYVKHGLGSYATPEEAHAAYVAAALRFHGEFARVA